MATTSTSAVLQGLIAGAVLLGSFAWGPACTGPGELQSGDYCYLTGSAAGAVGPFSNMATYCSSGPYIPLVLQSATHMSSLSDYSNSFWIDLRYDAQAGELISPSTHLYRGDWPFDPFGSTTTSTLVANAAALGINQQSLCYAMFPNAGLRPADCSDSLTAGCFRILSASPTPSRSPASSATSSAAPSASQASSPSASPTTSQAATPTASFTAGVTVSPTASSASSVSPVTSPSSAVTATPMATAAPSTSTSTQPSPTAAASSTAHATAGSTALATASSTAAATASSTAAATAFATAAASPSPQLTSTMQPSVSAAVSASCTAGSSAVATQRATTSPASSASPAGTAAASAHPTAPLVSTLPTAPLVSTLPTAPASSSALLPAARVSFELWWSPLLFADDQLSDDQAHGVVMATLQLGLLLAVRNMRAEVPMSVVELLPKVTITARKHWVTASYSDGKACLRLSGATQMQFFSVRYTLDVLQDPTLCSLAWGGTSRSLRTARGLAHASEVQHLARAWATAVSQAAGSGSAEFGAVARADASNPALDDAARAMGATTLQSSDWQDAQSALAQRLAASEGQSLAQARDLSAEASYWQVLQAEDAESDDISDQPEDSDAQGSSASSDSSDWTGSLPGVAATLLLVGVGLGLVGMARRQSRQQSRITAALPATLPDSERDDLRFKPDTMLDDTDFGGMSVMYKVNTSACSWEVESACPNRLVSASRSSGSYDYSSGTIDACAPVPQGGHRAAGREQASLGTVGLPPEYL